MRSIVLTFLCSSALLNVSAIAQIGTRGAVPDVSSLTYKNGISKMPYSRPAQSSLTGQVQLAVKLQDPPLVVAVGANAKQNGIKMTAAQQQAYLAQLKAKQDAVMSQIASLGGVELGRVSKGHNAVMISIDAKQLPALHNIAGVMAVRPLADPLLSTSSVSDGQPDLPTTLSYIGARRSRTAGSRARACASRCWTPESTIPTTTWAAREMSPTTIRGQAVARELLRRIFFRPQSCRRL